mgnify:CR=1 FL=1
MAFQQMPLAGRGSVPNEHSACHTISRIKSFAQPLVPAQMASFVSLFLKAETVQRFGLPIKEFFIWTDDWEFTRRISRALPSYVIADSAVVHAMKSKTVVNIATDSGERLSRYQYFYRNDVYLYRREGVKGWIWLLVKNIWHSIQVLCARKAERKKKWALIWNGFKKGKHFVLMLNSL